MSHLGEDKKHKTSLPQRFAKAGVVLCFVEAPTPRITIAYPLWSSVSMFHLKGQRILLFLLLIFVNVNIGILLWLEFVVQQKPLASLMSVFSPVLAL